MTTPTTTSNDKNNNEPGFQTIKGCNVLVTGSSGLCGARLVEMILERGGQNVIAFDIAHPDSVPYLRERFERIQQQTGGKIIIRSGKDGDLTNQDAIDTAFQILPNIDVCFHIGALVGPFYDTNTYYNVNTMGTKRIIAACLKYKCKKLVYSSSPSTRFSGEDIRDATEDELPFPPPRYLATYAETKALGEMEVSKACCTDLLTVSVAPHQVYGPYDNLFLPAFLETAGNGRLRVFGKGTNQISVCYVDNYCHGLLCGADALYNQSVALGKFYIVTDNEHQNLWKMLNNGVMAMKFQDLYTKMALPTLFLYMLAYVANGLGYLMQKKFKLNPFNVRMLTMDRYFNIQRAQRDLKYEPIVSFQTGWDTTIQWFQINWLPKFLEKQQQQQTSISKGKNE